MALVKQRTVSMTEGEWRLVKIAARRAGILEHQDVSASEIIRRGAAIAVKHIDRKWEARDG